MDRVLEIAALLLRVNMPHNVIGQAVYAVTGAFGHLGEALRLRLVLEGVAWEVDTWPVLASHVRMDVAGLSRVLHT